MAPLSRRSSFLPRFSARPSGVVKFHAYWLVSFFSSTVLSMFQRIYDLASFRHRSHQFSFHAQLPVAFSRFVDIFSAVCGWFLCLRMAISKSTYLGFHKSGICERNFRCRSNFGFRFKDSLPFFRKRASHCYFFKYLCRKLRISARTIF